MNKKGGCLIPWKKDLRSEKEGGLGIVNLKIQNKDMLIKFLHKFCNRLKYPGLTSPGNSFT